CSRGRGITSVNLRSLLLYVLTSVCCRRRGLRTIEIRQKPIRDRLERIKCNQISSIWSDSDIRKQIIIITLKY
ncbi:hypothetical protein PENTCL1PPCAC_24557, partial [Pristionchus entomophagus]